MATRLPQEKAKFDKVTETIRQKVHQSTGNYSRVANPMRVEVGYQIRGVDVGDAPGAVLDCLDSCVKETAARVALLDVTNTFRWASWYHLRSYVQDFVMTWLRLLRYSVAHHMQVPDDILRSFVDVGLVYNMMLCHMKSFRNKLSRLSPDFLGRAERAGIFSVDIPLLQVMLGAQADVWVAKRIAHAARHAVLVQLKSSKNKNDTKDLVERKLHDMFQAPCRVPVSAAHATTLLETILFSLLPVEMLSRDMTCNVVVAAIRVKHGLVHETAVRSLVWTNTTGIMKRRYVPEAAEVTDLAAGKGSAYNFSIGGASMLAMLKSAVHGGTVGDKLPALGGEGDGIRLDVECKDMNVWEIARVIAVYVRHLYEVRGSTALRPSFVAFEIMLLALFEKLYLPTYNNAVIHALYGFQCDVANCLMGVGLKWYPLPKNSMLERSEGLILARVVSCPPAVQVDLDKHEEVLAQFQNVHDPQSEGFEGRARELDEKLGFYGKTIGGMCHAVVASLWTIHRRVHVKKSYMR